MPISPGETGLALIMLAVGLLGGLLGNIIAGTFHRWRELVRRDIQTPRDLGIEFLISLILFSFLVLVLFGVGNFLIKF